MKEILSAVVFIVVLAGFCPGSAYALETKGDTLVVSQAAADLTPLNEIIEADTLEDGSRRHKVYELVPDGWYSLSAPITAATFNLNIVGGKRTADQHRPIILVKLDYGGWQMFTAFKDVTMKGIWIKQIAETPGGNIGPWARAGMNLASRIRPLFSMI